MYLIDPPLLLLVLNIFEYRLIKMYKPKIYIEKDQKKIWNFIEKYPFALVSGIDASGRQVATHVPLIVDEKKQFLQGHIMKNTDHYEAFVRNPQALVIFTGPNGYVSASWYKNPSAASTWNYMSVQIRGKLTFLNHQDFIQLMKRFTFKFEENNLNSKTIYENLPEDYRQKHMKAIAGFNIKIDSIEATFKLSQDRDEESFENILKTLKQKSHQEKWLADEMQLNRKSKQL